MIEIPPIPPIVIKLLGGLLAVLALLMLVHDRNQWKAKASERQTQLAVLCEDTRTASGDPKLECGKTGAQILELGKSLKTVTEALNDQNARVLVMKGLVDAEQAEAVAAAKKAAPRADRATSTAGRLEASSRDAERQARPCEPSPALKGAWK